MISIIIPTLNEGANLQATLAQLSQVNVEILVVDGGSGDRTVAIAAAFGAKIIKSLPGRSRQMNAGAAAASSEILLFLHADTRLPADFADAVHEILAELGTIAGAFRLRIEGDLAGLRWVERGVNWRSKYLQFPYGDQGIFLRADTFDKIGGFPDLPIMEDFELVRRLRRLGRVAIAPTAVQTSGRRWQKLGVVKTTLINQTVIAGYLLGVSPDRLASWYRQRRPKK